ncbi:MAG: O-antigen ligase family protein [Burkholderiales bacterium]|jgi:O-antigen ligase
MNKPKNLALKLDGNEPFSLLLAAICIYLTLAPVWRPGIAPRSYDDARYLELGMLLFVMLWSCSAGVANGISGAWLSLGAKTRMLIVILLAGGTLSALVSKAPNLGLLEVALTAQLIMLFGVIACVVREGKAPIEAALAISIFAGAGLCTLQFWVVYISYAFEGKLFPWISPFLEFANVRFFSQYQAYALFPVVIPLLMPTFRTRWRTLFFFVAVNFWALHWMVGTRAAWIGVLVAMTVVPLLMRHGKLSWLRWHAAAIFGGALIYAIFSYSVSVRTDLTPVPGLESIEQRDQGSIDERIALARIAVDATLQHPLLGTGPGQFGLQNYAINAAHPHNVLLQLWAEYGLIAGTAGISLGLLLLVYSMRTLMNFSARPPDAVGASLIAGLLTGVTDSMFSGNLIMPQSQILFFVIGGWIVGRSLPPQPAIYAEATAYRLRRLGILATGVLAAGVTTSLALEYLPLARELPAWLPRWNPHFWQYGRVYNW